jgi:hypothetical protein
MFVLCAFEWQFIFIFIFIMEWSEQLHKSKGRNTERSRRELE